MKTLIIDNYDSFTYNLFQLIGSITNSEPKVVGNDMFTWREYISWNIEYIIISPGPGRADNKKDFGMSSQIIQKATVPVLGVCLGHQGIGYLSGAKLIHSTEIRHGRVSNIFHTGDGLFTGIPQGFSAVRYHSYVIDPKTVPDSLVVTAWTDQDEIMGIKHKLKPMWGVQFHPESIGSSFGKKIIENFYGKINEI